ncbi:hypothetical protein SAMN05216241_106123 [Limimonas halophila]|uniref:General stress protein 17M-like domain-containing protein n=1 Tax=Limimonas halophila TaxID=1082479 RepID=A0A1G7S503_9PROT|nr:hypothetical protein [Limimonas halophila]SDG18105.1 hypothetical protein SAMN05216241_106123 [Limimonas halophila]
MADSSAPSAYGKYPESEASTIEVVGWFSDRDSFRSAVKALLGEGFQRTDLSVLDTHESLSAADSPKEVFKETFSGLVQEVNYIGPIAAAGFIGVATGPIGAMVSAVVAAGLTGYAVSDILKEVRATPHTDAFARAAENGAILLWVRAENPQRQRDAVTILEANGGQDVHTHERPKTDHESGGEQPAPGTT